MKRCPQCEFIYEDDQSLCDMDGVLLVLDSRTLPNMNALTTVPPKAAPKRNRAVPAFATLILALVLGMVYFVSTQRKEAAQTASTPAVAESSANPAPTESPVQVSAPQPEPEPQPAVEEPKAPTTKAAAVPVKKVSAKASTSSQTKAAPAAPVEKKEESKVGSILKKTGRILKKPFKL